MIFYTVDYTMCRCGHPVGFHAKKRQSSFFCHVMGCSCFNFARGVQ